MSQDKLDRAENFVFKNGHNIRQVRSENDSIVHTVPGNKKSSQENVF